MGLHSYCHASCSQLFGVQHCLQTWRPSCNRPLRSLIGRQTTRKTQVDPLNRWRAGCSAALSGQPAQPESGNGVGGSSAAPPTQLSASSSAEDVEIPEDFSIIESQASVKDFAALQLDEIKAGISSRRNRIFLLMEEVRRLRIQQRLRGGERTRQEEVAEEQYPSAVPLLPQRTDAAMKEYWRFYLTAVSTIILFGGLLAPILEVRMGLGGTTYADFIRNMHLPSQLAAVDPIVASFCGGAVGVLTTLLLVEMNNSEMQAKNRCIYCGGTGYVTCGSCSGEGNLPQSEAQEAGRCATCSGTGKVMCIGCLCTGKKVAHEHDPRLDPFF